ncbi:MAG: SOS response-associated peptidase [Parvibaculum sp.]|uniref:SOS response-associated peptidase n=1 Tax=Parvibaculum sp. TaxID=2024848 RepID=UPI0025CE6834|nr:SOS response-associated peptidase [Parvibaculum sp.]MCE9649714.1 SOS response-associated peptidase [Parvibaculum sp.]
MCGRYAITTPPQAMRDLYRYMAQPNFPPRYNVAPTQPVPIVRMNGAAREFALVRWGLIPSWAKEMPQSLLINARADTVADKPSFRGAFRHRRCLMPADGFYEWKEMGKGAKQPFFIRRRDRAPFAMAALWDNWMSADGSEIETCAVVTTEANATLAPVHHRMPVILASDDFDLWLDPAATPKELAALMVPAPDDLLEAIPVSQAVNRVANDGPHLTDPFLMPLDATPPKKKEKLADNRQADLF